MNKSKSPLVFSLLLIVLLALFIAYQQIPAAATDIGLHSADPTLLRTPDDFSGEGTEQPPAMATGVVLVGLKPGVTLSTGRLGAQANDATLSAALVEIGVQGVEPVFANGELSPAIASAKDEIDLSHIYRFRLAPEADVLPIVQALNAHPAVVYAEPDYLAHLIATPDDPLYPQQWAMTQIDAPTAWDVVTGTADVVVAIVDAGLDTQHADLAGQVWTNPGEIAGNGVDDDNNGYVDDIHGWNMVDDNADLSDNTGHGTQVAGVVAAATDNGEGVAGVCWTCRLMIVKVTQPGGVANYSHIAAGVAYAAQKGAEVINLSLGGYSDSATLRAAIAAAAQTAVVVGGSGNDNRSDPLYPAAYDEDVLAVAGTTSSDTKVGTSNYGAWVDVAAPGEVITTTFSGGGYGSTSGTSMAAPFAAGLAALLRSQHADWTPDMVRAQVIHTADDIDSLNPGYEGLLGSGRIDAQQAVTTAAQPLLRYVSHTVDGEPGGRPEPGSTVDLDVTLTNEWADATNVGATLSTSDVYVAIISGTAPYGDVAAYASRTNTTPFRFSVSGSAPYAHDMAFTLHVTADGGYAVSIPLTVPTSPGITYVHGTLTTQTWTKDRTYIVDNEAGIAAGETLTIEPGTVVRFDGGYSLSVAGTLIADGTQEQPIRFTSNQADPAAGDWGQIKFLDTSVDATFDGAGNYAGGSILRRTIIEYGQGVHLGSAAPYIAQNAFDHISGAGIGGSGTGNLVVTGNVLSGAGIELAPFGPGSSIVRNTVYSATVKVNGNGTLAGNSVSHAPSVGMYAQNELTGTLTVVGNRVVGCGEGIVLHGRAFTSGNLLADNTGHGLRTEWGAPTVMSNTVVFNADAGVYIQGGTPVLHHNNVTAGQGQYAVRNATANDIDATGNWWGTTDGTAIQAAIYDGSDEFGLGTVDYGGYLSGPEEDAPPYLAGVTLTPASPVGIETVTFDLAFSRPMDPSVDPRVTFFSTRRGTWGQFTSSNSPLPTDWLHSVAIEGDGTKWFGTDEGVASFDGTTWTVYNAATSDLPDDTVNAIAIEGEGIKWFGTQYGGVARFEGTTWTVYDSSNSGLPSNSVHPIAIERDGTKWFGTYGGGVARFDGSTWTVYDQSNSGLPSTDIRSIAVESNGNKWFGTGGGGVARFDGTTWTVYDTSNSGLSGDYGLSAAIESDGTKWFGTNNGVSRFDGTAWKAYYASKSGLPHEIVLSIAIGRDGTKWFGTSGGGVARFDGNTWTAYDQSNSGLLSTDVRSIAIEGDGTKWFGTGEGVAAYYGGKVHTVTHDAQWLDASHWRATYDVTSLVPRGAHTVRVAGAKGTDGIEMAADTRYTFTVDYAGEITDQTPPHAPRVIAGGKEGDPSTVLATWSASDPESAITGYRYAVGSTAGATDILNWTNTSSTSLVRSGLGLVAGHQYWLAVQARNEGGLWSASGYGAFVAGKPLYRVYLPVVLRRR